MKTTTLESKVQDYLQWSTFEYETFIFQFYWNWCSKNAMTEARTQQIIANSAINKWFMIELEKALTLFVQSAESLPSKKDILERVFYGLLAEIHTKYPKPLMDEVKLNISFKILFKEHLIYAN